eukprot:m.11947 g.11947  ORF g.11947 m.11947 type:complete len:392 (+) comp6005_c0_seq1:405-1580(+)
MAATARRTTMPARRQTRSIRPDTFIVGGNNNRGLVEGLLKARGWTACPDSNTLDFAFKWVELKRDINYSAFVEGQQMINRNPTISCLTTKSNLHDTLKAYQRACASTKEPVDLAKFVPLTFKLDDAKEKREFLALAAKEDCIWICKPTGMNQGKGIFLVTDVEDFKEEYLSNPEEMKTTPRIIQRYIPNPLLIKGRKFDMRMYMLIACASPVMAYYHDGYLRLSVDNYKLEDTENLAAHLTNQYVQKKHPKYSEVKDDTTWDLPMFNDYVNTNYAGKVPKDWVLNQMKDRIKEIMTHCVKGAKNSLTKKIGYFDLLGFDFMVDEHFNVWLIEINVNPALFTNCAALAAVIPTVVEETIDITTEIFQTRRVSSSSRVGILKSVRTFEEIYRE